MGDHGNLDAPETATVKILDQLINAQIDSREEVRSLTAAVRDLVNRDTNTNTTTVIHKTAGMGHWGAAAVTACFLTFLGLILFAMVVIPELHDLKAWSDIYRSKIYTLEKK
jgi:hypothetical protein